MNQVADPVRCSMNPANQDKQVAHTHNCQQVAAVGLAEEDMGTHYDKVVVAVVADEYRVAAVNILLWRQVVEDAAERMMAAAAAAVGNKVFEGEVGWEYCSVLAGKMFYEAVQPKGNCRCLKSCHLEN